MSLTIQQALKLGNHLRKQPNIDLDQAMKAIETISKLPPETQIAIYVEVVGCAIFNSDKQQTRKLLDYLAKEGKPMV